MCVRLHSINMEVVVDVPGAQAYRPVHGSARRGQRGFICSQGPSKLQLLMLITQITWAVAKRNTQIIADNTPLGPWNRTLQKDILHCSNFHRANTSDYFYYWPEDTAYFQHCCQDLDSAIQLTDYRYSMYGAHLVTAYYYDLGPIDSCLPYWYCRDFIERYLYVAPFYIECEYRDVSRLNTHRFWVLVVLRYGLAATAVPLIVLLQLFVCFAIGARHLYCRRRRTRNPAALDRPPLPKLQECSIEYWKDKAVWKNLCMDWLHLVLLSIIGNGLLEAVGRQDAAEWQSKLFYRYSKLYIAMSVVLWFSSLSYQFAMWVAVEERFALGMNSSSVTMKRNPGHDAVSDDSDPMVQLKNLLDLDMDWKWQPIVTQAAILFCLWAFLTYVNGSDLSATILGFIVQAASPWSLLYSFRVGFKTLPFLIKKVARVESVRLALYKFCCGCIQKPDAQKHDRRHEAERHEAERQDENIEAVLLQTPPASRGSHSSSTPFSIVTE